jgi:S1-C subfamily serine protease
MTLRVSELIRSLNVPVLIDAKVVQVDAANDLALLKADGRFARLPIAASRTGLLGGTVATVGFPDIGFAGVRAQSLLAARERKEHKRNFFAISVFFCG